MTPKPKPRTCDRCGIQEGSRSRSKLIPEALEPMQGWPPHVPALLPVPYHSGRPQAPPREAVTTPRKDRAFWDACAFCPDDRGPQNGRHAGEANAFTEADKPVEVRYRKRLRRVHPECLPLAVRAGAWSVEREILVDEDVRLAAGDDLEDLEHAAPGVPRDPRDGEHRDPRPQP